MENKFWKIKSTSKGFAGKWIDLDLDEIEMPTGKMITFEAVKFHRNGAAIVAENEKGDIMLVKSYRYINDFTGWEIPAGTIDPGKNPAETVIEELHQEAGCKVAPADVKFICEYYPSIGSGNQIYFGFHGKKVKEVTQKIDENEILEKRWFTKDEIKNMIKAQEIKDGFTLYMLMRVLFPL